MLGKLWAILPRGHRVRIVLVVAVALAAAAAEGAVVLLVDPVITGLLTSDGGVSSTTGPLLGFGAALVAKNVLVIVLSWVKNREVFAIQSEVSERLLEIYVRGTNPAVHDLDAGKRTSFAITEPLQLVLNGYLPVVNIVAESLTVVAVTVVLLIDRPLQTLALTGFLAVGLGAFSRLTRARIVAYGHRRKDSDTVRQELVRSVIESRVEVRGLGVMREVLDRYRPSNEESAGMTARKSFLTEASKNVLELLVMLAVLPVAVIFAISEGTELLSMLAMFGLAGYRAMPALNRVMVSSQSLKFGVATAETIHQIMVAEPVGEAGGDEPTQAVRPSELELRFDGFRLRNAKRVLDGQRIHLRAGQICALWGPSGSGKSTVLAALVDGAEGLEIRADGCVLTGGLSDLVGSVGVTAQSPLVLPATLLENLTLGAPAGSLDLEVAQPLLDRDPSSVLDGASIEQHLGDPIHRHALSGGQAQRISLVRALGSSHGIVLLDEPTSALDERVATALRERIAARIGQPILVVATHDPALRAIADVVVEI